MIPGMRMNPNRENTRRILNIVFIIFIAASIITMLVLASGTVMPTSSRIASEVIIVNSDYPGYEETESVSDSDSVNTYSFRLNRVPLGGECLSVWLVHRDARIYIGDELMYDSYVAHHSRLTQSPGLYWALVPLFEDDMGKEIRIEAHDAYQTLRRTPPAIILTSQGSLVSYCMRVEWPGVIVSIFCMVSGAIYAMMSFTLRAGAEDRRRGNFIGLFLVVFGVYRLFDMPIVTLLFFDHSMLITYINLICFMWMSAVFYLSESSRREYDRLFHTIGIIFSWIAGIMTILQLCGIRDLREDMNIMYLCMIIAFMIVLADYMYGKLISHRKEPAGYFAVYMMITIGTIVDTLLYYMSGSTRKANITLFLVAIYAVQSGVALIRRIASRNEELVRQRVELADRKGALMLSQIQPHFIYNTMNTIYSLCDINIEDAKKAIHDFSGYLRHNFGSMEKFGPVPFEDELKHTRFYLSIEKMRFGDELNVVYEIEETDFELPPISLQPIVENAVRHGLRNKPGGGTVTIRSRRTDDECVVTIEDDGVGFDTSTLGFQEPDSEHNRIALRNVSVRISQMCEGRLDIESEPGEGTVVTITIPVKKDI